MPNPPPRSRYGGVAPSSSRSWASSATARCAETSKPEVSKICEPMCECTPTSSSDGVVEDPAARLERVPAGQREAELLVLVRGGDELVGVRLHPHGGPDEHRLPPTALLGQPGQPGDLGERVDHDPADAGVERLLQLGDGLVVAVEGDPVRRHLGPQRRGQLAAGADVEPEALLDHPAQRRRGCRTPWPRSARRRPRTPARSRGSGSGSRPRPARTPGCRTRSPGRGRRPRRARARRTRPGSRSPARPPAASAPGSAGGTSSADGGSVTSACSAPASCVLTSHPVRRGDADQAETVFQHDPGRLAQREPGVHADPAPASPRARSAAPGRRRRTGGTCRPAPPGSGRPGAAPAARPRPRPPAGTRPAPAAGRPPARARAARSRSRPAAAG